MELRPREHEAQLPSRETAVDHLEVVDADLGLSLCVAGMEVWMPVGLSDDPRRVTQETAPGPKARRGADLALVGSYYEARLADLLERARVYGKAGCRRI